MFILVRMASELAIKSNKVRARFQKTLVNNMKAALSTLEIDFKIVQNWSRLYVECEDDKRVPEVLARIFGIQSFSVVDAETTSELEDIKSTGLSFYQSHVDGCRSFAVRARRTGKHDFTSVDVSKELGGALNQGRGLVNLTEPEIEIYVEVQQDKTYFFSKTTKGAGGLPLGTGGKTLVLISGGFDSAVAAWMLQKRGVEVDYLLCNVGDEYFKNSVIEIAKILTARWGYGGSPKLYTVDFFDVVTELKAKVAPRYVQVILKRLFYRSAECIMPKAKADAIVTGEAVGQVSSQTLKNLRAIDDATREPVIRPLVTFDKEDIIDLSRLIGVFDLCAKVKEYCQLVPDKPSTATHLDTAREQEGLFDLSVLDKAIEEVTYVKLRSIQKSKEADMFVDKVPEGMKLVDLRYAEDYEEWHAENAENIEYDELLVDTSMLTKDVPYVFYCANGMQSRLLAEKLRKEGFEAYSLNGGIKTLQNSYN